MDRQTFLMVTGLAMVGAVSSCTLDARDEAARAPTPMPTGDGGSDGPTGVGSDGGTDDAAAPECHENFDCCADPNVFCGRECRDEACACAAGFLDMNGTAADGCEYGCFPTNGGVEQCDGIDNDCDGAVDDDPSCSPAPAVTDTVTFAMTLPDGFPLDASRTLCSTFASGIWTCGDFALALGGDGRTLTTSGTAVSGPNVFNLCTSACDDPVLGTWVVVRNPDDTLSQAAVPTVTFAAVPVVTSVVRNARGTGGNWFAELIRP